MFSDVKEWLEWKHHQIQQAKWRLLHLRGIAYDKHGAWYWRTEHEYSRDHFEISLYMPSKLLLPHKWVGKIVVGELNGKGKWIIYDVKVLFHSRSRGVGTALVREAIRLARKEGAPVLSGFVTPDDGKEHPYLSSWYGRLGFDVRMHDNGVTSNFSMNLQSS